MSLCPLSCENYNDPCVPHCSCGQPGDERHCIKTESWDIRRNKAAAKDDAWKDRALDAEGRLLVAKSGLQHIWDLDSKGRAATPFLMHTRAEMILANISKENP